MVVSVFFFSPGKKASTLCFLPHFSSWRRWLCQFSLSLKPAKTRHPPTRHDLVRWNPPPAKKSRNHRFTCIWCIQVTPKFKMAFLRSMRGVLDNCFFYSGTLIFSAPWGRRLKFLRSRRISHAFSKPHTELKNALLNFGVAWLHHIPLCSKPARRRTPQWFKCPFRLRFSSWRPSAQWN